MRIGFKFLLMMLLVGKVFSQDTLKFFPPSLEFDKKRFVAVECLHVIGYGGSFVLLNNAWYKDYKQTSFHFFDDHSTWLQIDKAGHITTSMYLSRVGIDMMEWSGVEKKKAIWYGTSGSFLYLTGIEMLDGFSEGWGFSWSDFSANMLGTGLIMGQKILSCKRGASPVSNGLGGLSLKFSFHQTFYTQYRPELLGKTYAENILKDYNGQTYWLSFNISSFMREETKFPKWLNIALGYGAEGMTGGRSNPVYISPIGVEYIFDRYRQYYFSLDIDLTRIKTKSYFLKTLAETFCFIKIPAPALEWNRHGMKFHPIYY